MKLTLQIKLLPTGDQFEILKNTLIEANAACNVISGTAFTEKLFNQYGLHHKTYHTIRSSFNLSAQMVARCISKVAEAYKLDKKVKRKFRNLGAITYDSRILTYRPDDIISLWTIGGRLKIPFVCHNRNYLPYIKGESDLVLKKDKFYIFQTVEVPEEDMDDVEEFIGVDFGMIDIAVTSDNKAYSAKKLNKYIEKRQRIRSSIQRKGTKSAKRLLKRLSGKEKTTAIITNHTISKAIVATAKDQGKGIAIEDLTHIRTNSKRRNKKFRIKLGSWNFHQLRSFMEYKSLLNGVPLVVVDPRYTSQTCSECKHIGQRRNKSFKCTNCGNNMDADFNASINIALLGAAINQPERSSMYCVNALHI